MALKKMRILHLYFLQIDSQTYEKLVLAIKSEFG